MGEGNSLLRTPENPEFYVAFDYPNFKDEKAQELISLISEYELGVKIGTVLSFPQAWTNPIKAFHSRDINVFADTKLDDTPSTVSQSIRTVFDLEPHMVNMHASSGEAALSAFIDMRARSQAKQLKAGVGSVALAVTVLSSKDRRECWREYHRSPRRQAMHYALNAVNAGFDGLVCSGEELSMFRKNKRTSDLTLVALGIRSTWMPHHEQRRTVTPAQAIRMGASDLVLGRQITDPPSEVGSIRNAIEKTLEEIEAARAA